MKILFATQVPLDRPYGGARHVSAVARELAKLGHAVTLLAPGDEDAPKNVKRVRPPSVLRPGTRMEAVLAALASTIDKPDIAYVRISASSSLIPLALALRRIPIVLELNGRILDEMRELGRSPQAIAVARASLRQVVRLARALVAVEPKIALHAEKELGAANVHVIENGADLDAATPGDREHAKQTLALDPHTRYVAYTGTLVPEQRFDLLLDAHAKLDSFTLLIAGDGAQAPLIKNAAAARGKIKMLGTVPHPTAIGAIRAADACINVRDGDLGMKCFEYAAVGRRFVAFRYEGTERFEALYPGEEAVHLVDERTADGVAHGIANALDAEARRGPLSKEAIEKARSTIGWDHTARRIAEVLASCA